MKKTKLLSSFISVTIIFLLCFNSVPRASALGSSQIESYITSAINARKNHDDLTGASILGCDKFTNPENGGSNAASSTWSDWLAFAMGRFGVVYGNGKTEHKYNDGNGYKEYLKAMRIYISDTYSKNNGLLNSSKATEWQRAALTVAALDGDPESFGTYNGYPINLIADGSYNCVVKNGPARQGINGVIFALIAENSGDYSIPSSVKYSDEYLITYILKHQLPDGVNGTFGGWALNGNKSDPDITAMAIQALSRYYSSGKIYNYQNSNTDTSVSKTVKTAVDEALNKLSDMQLKDGDYSSWGTINVESTAQVLVALTELGIDPLKDDRFIKNGNTLLDGILKYRLSDGAFCHSFQADPGNSNAEAGKYNYMATDQACYSLVAYWRYINGLNSLYNCRPDKKSVPASSTAATAATKIKTDRPKASVTATSASSSQAVSSTVITTELTEKPIKITVSISSISENTTNNEASKNPVVTSIRSDITQKLIITGTVVVIGVIGLIILIVKKKKI